MGRGRRSRSSSRSSSGSPSRSRSRSRSPYGEQYRVHVADLGIEPSRRELVKQFEKFGKIADIWVAKNPPCFAFIVYKHKREADDAIKEMNGQVLSGGRIRVSYARPRTRGRKRQSFDPSLRCYQCGEKGHFSRDCDDIWGNRRRYPRRSISRSRSRSPGRRSRRPRNRSRSRNRKSRSHSSSRRSRSRSRSKEHKKGRKTRSRERSQSKERKDRKDSKSHSKQDRSQSKERKSASKEQRSHSKEQRHQSKERKSRSKERKSGSKERSGSKDGKRRRSSDGGKHKSHTKDRKSENKDDRSRSRSHSRDRKSQSKERTSRTKDHKSQSESPGDSKKRKSTDSSKSPYTKDSSSKSDDEDRNSEAKVGESGDANDHADDMKNNEELWKTCDEIHEADGDEEAVVSGPGGDKHNPDLPSKGGNSHPAKNSLVPHYPDTDNHNDSTPEIQSAVNAQASSIADINTKSVGSTLLNPGKVMDHSPRSDVEASIDADLTNDSMEVA